MQKEPKMEDSVWYLRKALHSTHQGHRKSQGVFELSTLRYVNSNILKQQIQKDTGMKTIS
jgi:hypothetical protein